MLVCNSIITMESIADANGKCPTLPRMFSSKTSKQSIATVAFNDGGWGCAMRPFIASTIKKAQLVVKFEVIERVAKKFSKGKTHVLESLSTPEAPEDSFNGVDECASGN